MDIFYLIVNFFVRGGVFMFPILFVATIGAAIAIERYITLTRMRASNRAAWSRIEPVLANGDFEKARELTGKDDTAISRLLSMGLALQGAVRRRDDVEKAMDESLLEIIPRMEKRTHYLSALANIGMLTGLLGTVIGLISAFASIAQANPAEKASLLAASISVAMNNTASGLLCAITLLLAHMFLEAKTTKLIDSLEIAAVKFLNSVVERRQDVDAGDEHPAPRGRTAHGIA